MACGKTCGALAGAVGCLGILTINTELQKDSPDSRALIKKFMEVYTEKFENCNCSDLRPVVAKKDIRCADFVGEVAQLVSDFAKENIK